MSKMLAKWINLSANSIEDDGSGNLRVNVDDVTIEAAAGGIRIVDAGVDENKLNATVAGNGLTGGGGSALAVGAGNGISAAADEITVDADSETGGNIQPVNLTANGVGLDINAISGTGLEADGSANLRLASQGNGIAGGAGSTLSVQVNANKGIKVDGSGVAIDEANASTAVSISAGTWTFTKDTLQVTGIPDSANDAVNKNYVDNQISGLTWKDPVDVFNLIGNATVATLNGLSPSTGDAYVVTGATATPTAGTSDEMDEGDIAEFDGTSWKIIVPHSGNFPPSGTRAILSTATALVSPYTDATDDGKIISFSGSSLTGADTSDAAEGNAVLIQDATDVSVYDNLGYVFNGTVATGLWIQFTGAGQINAGAGLSKSGNTLNIGDAGKGVQVNADDLEIDASEIASTGLEQSASTHQLRLSAQGNGIAGGNGSTLSVDSDTETGGNIQGANVTANGVGLDINAIAGTGIEADGSANLRLASQGNGIAGGAGSTLSVDSDTETGGNILGVNITANGVGVDIGAIDGNGLTAASASLSIDSDTETGGNIQGVNVTANGVGVDINAIAGTGLEADGSANLRLAAQGNGISGGAGSTLSIDQSALLQSGSVELDGDKVDIDSTFSNITPNTSQGTVDDAAQLGAILAGIDDALADVSGETKKVDILTYSGALVTNKVIGPLSATPEYTDQRVELTPFGGSDQEHAVDYTVAELTAAGTTGLSLGFYIMVATDSISGNDGTWTGSAPSTGIDTILASGDKVKVSYAS